MGCALPSRRKIAILIPLACFLYLLLWTWTNWHIPVEPLPRRTRGIPVTQRHVFANHAVGSTVVVVPVNTGMLHFADNLRCSLSNTTFNPSQIIYWALDKGAEAALQERGLATYFDPSLWSVSGNENAHGDTEAYKKMMRQRPQFYIDVLSAGYDILMIDADFVFWQSPLLMVDENVDVVYSTDAREFYATANAFKDPRRKGSLIPPICNGLFWMKSKPATMALWARMLDVFEGESLEMKFLRKTGFSDDQRGMDVMLNDGRAKIVPPYPSGLAAETIPKSQGNLTVRLLDQTQYVNGQLLMFREEEYARNLKKNGGNRVAAHMNWDTRKVTKDEGARKKGIFYLTQDGKCTI